jgi:integrase
VGPSRLGHEDIRCYLLHLIRVQKKGPASLKMAVAAIRFLFVVTLRRPEIFEGTPWPKIRRPQPVVLSGTEVEASLGAIESIKYRAVVMCAYGAGLRISEACTLKPSNIDRKRSVIHVEAGKRRRDRYVGLSPRLLGTLEAYWRSVRPPAPHVYLFPGPTPGSHVRPATVRAALKAAARTAGVTKRANPHVMRHYPDSRIIPTRHAA